MIGDDTGCWVVSFTRFVSSTNSLIAELWVVREGLLLAQSLNIQRMIIELDAQLVVNFLKSTHLDNDFLTLIILDCRKIFPDFREVQVQHNYWEENSVADIFGKDGTQL